jgi:hypothetical protein
MTLAAWSYPVLLVASFYLTWLLAWAELGHRPVASADDPSGISMFVDMAYLIPGLSLILFPLAMTWGINATVWFGAIRRWSTPSILLSVGFLLCVWIIAFAVLRWDPLCVLDWYMD